MGNEQGAFVPVFNPPVPYRGYLPMSPTHGSSVVINGIVPTWCNRFEINLETDNGDVALHFNPRFEGTNQVIRNSCRSGSWGSEERHGYFPFSLGGSFEVMILIEEHHFKVAVNGQHFCEFSHRIPKDFVRRLGVQGDVQLTQIRFQGGAPPVHNPPVPANIHIPGGLHTGKIIRINGHSSHHASRFNVNLVHGNGFNSNSDVGLHFDVRYHYGDNRNVVVRNHRQYGNWGNEERHSPYFPFSRGSPFEIIIRVDHDKYNIAVNNQHLFDFHHRIHPVSRFDHLFIDGDVHINSIHFQ